MRDVSALVSIGIAAFMLLAECGKNSSPTDSGETTGPMGADGGGGVGPLDGGPGIDGSSSGGFPNSGATEAGGVAVDVSITKGVDAPSGCGLVDAPTGVFSNQTITIGGQARTYVLSVPKSYDPSTPLALVFGWHGHDGTGFQARQSYAIEPSAAGSAIFVYPDGVTGGADWDYSPTGIDVALFDALVSYLAGSYCIDRNRIFSTGLSAGAYFTNLLGCCRGDVLRAIAPVAGGPPSAATCAGQVGAWVAHASNDALLGEQERLLDDARAGGGGPQRLRGVPRMPVGLARGLVRLQRGSHLAEHGQLL